MQKLPTSYFHLLSHFCPLFKAPPNTTPEELLTLPGNGTNGMIRTIFYPTAKELTPTPEHWTNRFHNCSFLFLAGCVRRSYERKNGGAPADKAKAAFTKLR